MNLNQLLSAYNQVATKQTLPQLRADQLSITTHDLDNPDTIWRQLAEFAPDSGWLCFQSQVADILPGHPLPEPSPDSGVLLSAECHNGRSGHSLHLRQNSHGGWRLSQFRPGDGEPCLSEDLQLIAHQSAGANHAVPRRLCYRRYWTLNADGVSQLAACFTGFDTPGGQP